MDGVERMKGRLWNNEKGLTLLELLTVLVMLGIIAAIAVPSVLKIIENTKKDAHLSNARMLVNAARLYMVNEYTDFHPTDHSIKLFFKGEKIYDGIPYYGDLVLEGYIDSAPEPPGSYKEYHTTNSYVIITKVDDGNFVYKVRLVSDTEWPDIAYICNDKPVQELTREDVEVKYKSENSLKRCSSHVY